jgi:hypothetical protein
MSAQEREDWIKGQDLDDAGYAPKPEPAIRLHGSNETTKHLMLKSLVAQVLRERGHKFDTEVKGPNGRVDVLDFGLPDSKPVVYEVETDLTPQARREKAAQYAVGPVRDVLFLDPTDAPDDIHAMKEWVEEQVVG